MATAKANQALDYLQRKQVAQAAWARQEPWSYPGRFSFSSAQHAPQDLRLRHDNAVIRGL